MVREVLRIKPTQLDRDYAGCELPRTPIAGELQTLASSTRQAPSSVSKARNLISHIFAVSHGCQEAIPTERPKLFTATLPLTIPAM